MATPLPEGEAIRRAVKWVSAELQDNACAPVQKLVENATLMFDLSPKDSEFLARFFREGRDNAASA